MTNINQAEIAKFGALAERWWNTSSEFKPLHDINALRSQYIDERAPVAGKKILNIGCGGGILCESLALRGAEVTGIDMGEAPLNVARLHGLESNLEIDYRQVTAEDLVLEEPEHYDIVTCLEMLEYAPDPISVILACAALVKPGGHVFLSTINRNLKAYTFTVVSPEYLLKILPRGIDEYTRFIKPSELDKWAQDSGLSPQDITGMTYNPTFKRYWLNPNNVDVNYLAHYQKLVN